MLGNKNKLEVFNDTIRCDERKFNLRQKVKGAELSHPRVAKKYKYKKLKHRRR